MKRIEWTIAAVLLATMPLGVALAVEQAGVTAAVRGDVNLDPVGGEVAHLARSGEDVFLGDGISSGDRSGLQLMLLDETIFTIGANTELTVDEFVYDPATGAGQMSASLTKGLFRFVAGKIAQGDPEDMTITLPVGVLGIRGTTGLVGVFDESLLPMFGDSDALDYLDLGEGILTGSVILTVLLETEKDGDPDNKGIVVSAQGESVELTVPGFASIIVPGRPPTPPFFAPEVLDMGGLFANLTPSGPPGGGPGAPLVDTDGGGGTLELGGLDGPIDGLLDGPLGPPPVPEPDISTESAIASTEGQTVSFTTFDQLFALSGTATYSGNGSFTQTLKNNDTANFEGTFSVSFDIDFTNKTFCFSSCSISVNTSSFGGNISDSTAVNSIDYSDDFGLAAGILEPEELTNNNFAGTSLGLLNTDGITGNQIAVLIIYDDGSGNQGSGGGLSDPRSP